MKSLPITCLDPPTMLFFFFNSFCSLSSMNWFEGKFLQRSGTSGQARLLYWFLTGNLEGREVTETQGRETLLLPCRGQT